MYPCVAITTKGNEVVQVETALGITRPWFDVMGVQSVVSRLWCSATNTFISIAPIYDLDKLLPKGPCIHTLPLW